MSRYTEKITATEPLPPAWYQDLDKQNVTIYSYIMSKHEKLLNKASNNPAGLSFSEFETLMTRCGWAKDHQSGSHQIWYSSKGHRISIQNKGGKAKGYQVKQFLTYYMNEQDTNG